MNISNSYSQKIFDKIDKNDVEYLKKYLQKPLKSNEIYTELYSYDSDVDSTYFKNASLFLYASLRNCTECFKELIKNKELFSEYVDFKYEMTLSLAYSISNNNKEIFDLSIENGADINGLCEMFNMENAGMIALGFGRLDMFLVLLGKGYNINIINKYGENIFHKLLNNFENNDSTIEQSLISLEKTNKLIDLFLKRGVDINKKDIDRITPLIISACSNNPKLYNRIKSLSNRININDTAQILSLLNYSLYYHDRLNVERVYRNIFDLIIKEDSIKLSSEFINHSDLEGGYLLLECVFTNNINLFNRIIKYKPNVNVVDESGQRPIYLAIVNKNIDMCNELLDNGAEVDKEILKLAKSNFPDNIDLIRKIKKAPKGIFSWDLILKHDNSVFRY